MRCVENNSPSSCHRNQTGLRSVVAVAVVEAVEEMSVLGMEGVVVVV
jgi:hypothetical protein